MKLLSGRTVTFFFVTVLFLYFISEAMLREAALAKLTHSQISIDTVLAKLPQGMRERVRHKIEYGKLKDALANAKSPAEKVIASIALGSFEPEKKREQRYAEIIRNFPDLPEASVVFQFFLLERNKPASVSIEDYHRFITICPPEKRPQVWMSGIYKIEQIGENESTQFEFLAPLLSYKPEFRDYEELYRKLRRLAEMIGLEKERVNASKQEEECVELPYLEDFLIEQERIGKK